MMSDLRLLLTWRPPASRRQWSVIVVLTLVSVVTLLSFWHDPQQMRRIVSATLHSSTGVATRPLCRQLPGADDVLVVLKTGANEIPDKLDVHLRTTLTCYPNHVIFSDYEEDLATGQHLFDAFKYTSSSIKENHKDFALWRKLQADGRAGILPDELSGTDSRYKPEDIRKTIPGWQLDKWKFLPMVNQTYHMYPNKHWYVFVEADTSLVWSNLLLYLEERLWTQDHYIGSREVIEELGFAHGGSGFLLSRPALEKVARLFDNDQDEWEKFNDRYWVGDHILAVALRDAGILLTDGFPSWQGSPLDLLGFEPYGRTWCSPAMTFHHQRPTEIEDLWEFEQAMIAENAASRPATKPKMLSYRKLLERYALPRIQQIGSTWNNKADQWEKSGVTALHECLAICDENPSCMQYALHEDGTCMTASKVLLGEASDSVNSGWMFQRIQRTLNESAEC